MNATIRDLVLVCSAVTLGVSLAGAQPAAVPAPGAPPATANPVGPKIQFATPVYDFGRVKAGEPVKHDFVFTNTGDALLLIQSVQPGCGCTTIGEWTKQVEPGKTGIVPIQFNTANYNSPVVKTPSVTCNVTSQPTVVLQLKGTVYRPLDVNPQLAVLNIGADAEGGSTVVTITNNTEDSLTLEEPKSNNRKITAELKTVAPGKGYQLAIATVPPLSPGGLQAMISLKTSWTNQPVLNVSVYANVQPPINVVPQHITLPAAPLDSPQTPSVTIQNNTTNALTLSEPAMNVPGVDVRIEEKAAGRTFVALAAFPQGFELKPGQAIELTVKTSNPKQPLIKVPVTQLPHPVAPQPPANPPTAAAVHPPPTPLAPIKHPTPDLPPPIPDVPTVR
jgi:hypothetical protein